MPTTIRTSTVRSAGGVVLRQGVRGLEVLLIATHGTRRWSLPKGRLEEGEEAADAAIREVREETGITAHILGTLETTEYWFFAERYHRMHKFVDYFLMGYSDGYLVPQYSEVDAARWVPVGEADMLLSYSNDRRLVQMGVELWETGE